MLLQSDLSLAKYDLSKAAIEADTGLRLLVTVTVSTASHDEIVKPRYPYDIEVFLFPSPTQAGAEVVHRRVYEEWALENGFEYIEIDTSDPTKGKQQQNGSLFTAPFFSFIHHTVCSSV